MNITRPATFIKYSSLPEKLRNEFHEWQDWRFNRDCALILDTRLTWWQLNHHEEYLKAVQKQYNCTVDEWFGDNYDEYIIIEVYKHNPDIFTKEYQGLVVFDLS